MLPLGLGCISGSSSAIKKTISKKSNKHECLETLARNRFDGVWAITSHAMTNRQISNEEIKLIKEKRIKRKLLQPHSTANLLQFVETSSYSDMKKPADVGVNAIALRRVKKRCHLKGKFCFNPLKMAKKKKRFFIPIEN